MVDDREELEQVPWADLMAETDPEDRRRRTLYLAAGLLGAMVLGVLVARSWWSPASVPAIAPGTTLAGDDEVASSAATVPDLTGLPLYSEADLMADPPDPAARAAVVRAEWFVTDYFTADLEPDGSAEVRAALPTGAVLPDFPQDGGEGISYVEWARAFDVEPASDGEYLVSVAFRTLGAPPGRGFSRQPVRAVSVLVGVSDGGGATVLDLPSPIPLPAGPEPAPWPEETVDPPQQVVDVAAARASAWGSEPRISSAAQVGDIWRVVVTVADSVGNRWPLVVMVAG
ncbi:MAG TPA: hypothetical protein VJP05_00050 [Acidimicrobiia bacterium]|nr:hypothetical protein [Acidimicrobiia bacterium]